jgi:hypothetical protein
MRAVRGTRGRRLHDRVVSERRVEDGRPDAVDPVPQRDVRRGRLLRLQRDHPPGRVDNRKRLSAQEVLNHARLPARLDSTVAA